MRTYDGMYKALCLSVEPTRGMIKAQVPQVFSDVVIIIRNSAGSMPFAGARGWVGFENGQAERPVWVGTDTLVGESDPSGSGGGGGDGSGGWEIVETSSLLPSSPAIGARYFVNDINNVLEWSGSAWTNLADTGLGIVEANTLPAALPPGTLFFDMDEVVPDPTPGPPGAPGAPGATGATGPPGPPGIPGAGVLYGTWSWLSAASTPPLSTNRVALNTDAPSAATAVYIHKNDEATTDFTAVINTLVINDEVFIQQFDDYNNRVTYKVTAVPTLASNTFTIPVALVAGSISGVEPNNGKDVLVAFRRAASGGGGGGGILGFHQQTSDYTVALADVDYVVQMNVAVSNVATIPPVASVAWVANQQIHFHNMGVGQTRIAGGAGVTVLATPGKRLRAQNSMATAICTATPNTWILTGDLTADAPVATVAPTITLGITTWLYPPLTASTGTWPGAPTFTYQWQERASGTSGAWSNSTGSGYNTATYLGTAGSKAYRCQVTATDSSGSGVAYSEITEVLGAGLSQSLSALSTLAHWTLCGAEGGRAGTDLVTVPGKGEKRTFDWAHTLAETCTLNVGTAGSQGVAGTNGGGAAGTTGTPTSDPGGGGGACDLRLGGTALANRKGTAGGGGGAGMNNGSTTAGGGGLGGGTTGGSGQNGTGTTAGAGGSQVAGGAAGTGQSPTAGSSGQGGTGGGGAGRAGGGGGAGFFGGGGGGGTVTGGQSGSGGGGGSGNCDAAATLVTSTQGHRSGDSLAVVVWAGTGLI